MENKGTGEKERGNGEELERWKLKKLDEELCIYWAGREGLKILALSHRSYFV